MKRYVFAGPLLVGAAVLAGCSSTPTQSEAEQAVCDSLAQVRDAAGEVKELNAGSTIDEARAARDSLDTALADLKTSAADVTAADTSAVEAAVGEIDSAISGVQGGDTLADAAAQVKMSTSALTAAVDQMTNGLQCSAS